MRAVARLVVVVLVVGSVFAGCLASGPRSDPATRVAAERVDAPAATTTTAGAVVTAVMPPQPSPSVARNRAVVPTRSQPAVAQWARFDRQLTGGSYLVAHAAGASVPVSPAPGAAPAVSLSNPLRSGAPRVLLVVGEEGDWLQVLLPLRPNASAGWIRRGDVTLRTVQYRVEIDRAAHRVRVFDAAESVVVDEPAAMGTPSAPTPTGQFFTIELLQPPNPAGAYGPYAFTLSAYSEVYQTFGSGDGAVGVHGTNDPSSIGRDASHGCVRLSNEAITRLAGMLPLGTPVFIR